MTKNTVSNSSPFMQFIQLMCERSTVIKALKVAFIVGIILNLINQGEALSRLSFSDINYPKLLMTFCVPYLVSTYSAAMAKMSFKTAKVVEIEKDCSQEIATFLNTPEISPYCSECGKKK